MRLSSRRIRFLLLMAVVSCCLGNCGDAEEVLYEQALRPEVEAVVVPTNLDGIVVPMYLDTGSDSHVLDPSMRSHFGPFVEYQDFGGSHGANRYRAPEMALGKWKLPADTLLELDCVAYGDLSGIHAKGFLGVGAMRRVAIDFNFDTGRLRFIRDFKAPGPATRFKSGENSDDMQYVPMKSGDGPLCVDVAVEDIPLTAVIDTGAITCVGLRHETFEKLVASGAIARVPDSPDEKVVTALGTVKDHTGTFTKGNILGVDLEGLPVDDADDVDFLGVVFLLNFNFVCDAAAKRFYFQRRHGEPPLNYVTMLGAKFSFPEGHCEVSLVSPGSTPAKDAGLQKDDIILRLGPLKEKELNRPAIYKVFETYAGQTIEVEYSRAGEGQTHQTRVKLPEKQFLYPPGR